MDILVSVVSAIGRSTIQHALDAIVRHVADDRARGAYLDAVAAFCINAVVHLQNRPQRTAELVNQAFAEAKSPVRLTLVQ